MASLQTGDTRLTTSIYDLGTFVGTGSVGPGTALGEPSPDHLGVDLENWDWMTVNQGEFLPSWTIITKG